MKYNITTASSPVLSLLQLYKTIDKVPTVSKECNSSYAVSNITVRYARFITLV
jgi:hypothetical protein